jgi:hypothetical protein
MVPMAQSNLEMRRKFQLISPSIISKQKLAIHSVPSSALNLARIQADSAAKDRKLLK